MPHMLTSKQSYMRLQRDVSKPDVVAFAETSVLRRWGQEAGFEFKASLGYIVVSRPAQSETLSQK